MPGERALEVGCRLSRLETSTPEARRFYERAGYERFGSLEDGPERRLWFFRKRLNPTV